MQSHSTKFDYLTLTCHKPRAVPLMELKGALRGHRTNGANATTPKTPTAVTASVCLSAQCPQCLSKSANLGEFVKQHAVIKDKWTACLSVSIEGTFSMTIMQFNRTFGHASISKSSKEWPAPVDDKRDVPLIFYFLIS